MVICRCMICIHSQVGFLVSMGMLLIALVTIVTTVFAISAIATSANVEKGGVYCIPKYTFLRCTCVLYTCKVLEQPCCFL